MRTLGSNFQFQQTGRSGIWTAAGCGCYELVTTRANLSGNVPVMGALLIQLYTEISEVHRPKWNSSRMR